MSSPGLTLTDEELRELTKRRRSDAMRRALLAMGIPFRVRHDGSIAVMRSHVERDPSAASVSIVPREPEMHL